MQKLIIQIGVVTTLAGTLLPVHAGPNLRITLDGGHPVSHNNYGYQRDDKYRYDHRARKYQKKQRKFHRRARAHDRGYRRSPHRYGRYNHDRRHSYDRRHQYAPRPHYDRGHRFHAPRRRHH